MTTPAPILARWDGERLEPARRHAKTLAASLVIGEWYFVEVVEQRSMASHRHYFAQLTEIWRSIPEEVGERYPSVESFRKACLIACGFCHKTEAVCATNRQALALAATIGRMDDYALVEVRDRALAVWTADSQSLKAMGKETFQKSKQAVLEWTAAQIGARPEELPREETP